MTAKEVIDLLGLEPLEIEGGMFRCMYVNRHKIGEAPATQAIYYLLTENTFSHLHRLTSDEVWHFYMGDPVELCSLNEDGSTTITVLGTDLEAGMRPQYVVIEGTWRGARLVKGGKWALLGTQMCPCYTEGCYSHGDREELIKKYPEAKEYIESLTGPVSFY